MSSSPSPDEPKPRFSLRRFVQRRLRFIAVAMPLACALLLLPFEGYIFELLRHFRLWNAVIGLAAALLLFLLRDWKFALLSLFAGLWQGWPVWSYSSKEFYSPSGYGGPENYIDLLTANLLYECRDPAAMITSLREANPDVLLLQEFTPKWQTKFAGTLWKDYPHRIEHPEPEYTGICLASKRPLENGEVIQVNYSPVIRAQLTIAGQRLTLLGVHPPPPMRPELYETWRDAFAQWPLLLLQTKTPHRVLAGDLNSSPFAHAFTTLCDSAGLHDSARGFELTNTWHLAGTPLGLPLDHILVSSDIAVAQRTIGPAAGSDHHWVMTRLVPLPP